MLDKFGGLGSTLLNIAKFFTMNPVGLAIIGATSLMVLLGRDKDPEATNQGIQNAGKADGGMAEAITNIEGSDRRRSKILRAAYESGELKQQGAWYSFSGRKKEAEQEKKYLEALGFDPKTGLTQADRDKGFNFVDPDTGEASYSKVVDKEGKPTGKREYRNAQGKSMGESVEQIDELSKDTLKSYRLKSIGRASDFENKGYAAAKGSAGNDKSDKLFNKADAVTASRKRALEKMKEEVDQIEEEIAGWIAHYNGQKHEIKKHEAKDLYDAKQKAIAHFKAPKSKHGLIAVKPAYNESVELEEGQMKRIATDKEEDERLKSKSWKKETPWMKVKNIVTDKSGAKHGPMSRARDLARKAAIVKEAADKAKAKKKEKKESDDTFQANPELSTQIIRND